MRAPPIHRSGILCEAIKEVSLQPIDGVEVIFGTATVKGIVGCGDGDKRAKVRARRLRTRVSMRS